MKTSLVAAVTAILFAAACTLQPADPPGAGGGSGAQAGAGSSLADEDAALGKLDASLNARRSEVLKKSAMELEAIGNSIFYRTYPGIDPVFHRREADGTTIDYGFSIGSGDFANDRVSDELVVTALRKGDQIEYRVYDAHAKNSEKGVAKLPAPTDEQRWWAYAVSGTTVYMITTPTEKTGPGHTIWTYQPGGEPKKLFDLEDGGMDVGIFYDFGVDGDTLVMIESGRLWRVDLKTKKAQYLKNQTEISGAVNFAKDGVAFEDAKGLKFFDYATSELRDLSAEIKASPYRITPSRTSAHTFYDATTSNDFTRYQSWIVYTGSAGIFAYDLAQQRVAPVLLDVNEEGLRISYRYPVVTDDGTAYLVGLTSASGSVGADGPVYKTSLEGLLPR